MLPQRLIDLKALRWKMIGGGAAAFVGFGFAQALLAEAHWLRLSNIVAMLCIGGWIVCAAGIVVHVYIFYKLTQYPPERPN